MPVKHNRRIAGGGGSVVGRFIPPSQACVVNKREVGENGDEIRSIWEGRGQGRCRGREAGICLPWKGGGKPSLGEAWLGPQCCGGEGRIGLGGMRGAPAGRRRSLHRPGGVLGKGRCAAVS